MATYDNDNRAGGKSSARDVARTKKVARVTKTMATGDAALDTIFLFTAPKDAVVTGYSVYADGTISATAATLDIGSTSDADGILDGGNIVSGAIIDDVIKGVDVAGEDVYATLATLTGAVTAGTVLTIEVHYDFST